LQRIAWFGHFVLFGYARVTQDMVWPHPEQKPPLITALWKKFDDLPASALSTIAALT
jgi:hypothetical protein